MWNREPVRIIYLWSNQNHAVNLIIIEINGLDFVINQSLFLAVSIPQ